MTPTKLKALQWVRDNGNILDIPEVWEPSKRMITALRRDDLIFWTPQWGRTYKLTSLGLKALEEGKTK